MNELFELLHRGRPAFGVFAIDVVVFIAMVVMIRAVIFLAKHDMAWILNDVIKGSTRAPKFLNTKPTKGKGK